MRELEFEDIQQMLSVEQEVTDSLISRRAFLGAVAAGVSIAAMPDWMRRSAAYAAPLKANEGVLVAIQLGGGCDGLNTVVPIGNGKYHDARPTIGLKEADALPIAPGVGLHPALKGLQKRYQDGDVAVVQGVSYASPNLSHFESIAIWQAGVRSGEVIKDGWLGRYVDNLGTDPLHAITYGTSVPLHMRGSRTAATTLPLTASSLFGARQTDLVLKRLTDSVKQMGAVSTGRGALTDRLAATTRSSLMMAQQMNPLYSPNLTQGNLVPQMELTARLINANLGTRVFSVSFGTFDSHGGQTAMLQSRLTELDTAIEKFFATLDPAFASRVTLMTFSEFGRRVNENGSGGTDHGTSAPLFVIGKNVRGGLYGEQPSLSDLDSSGNLKTKVTFHSVYATLLDRWFGADSRQLLNGTYEDLGFIAAAPGAAKPHPDPNNQPPMDLPWPEPAIPSTRPITWPASYRVVTAAGGVGAYGGVPNNGTANSQRRTVGIATTPDQKGYWIATDDGAVFALGEAAYHGGLNDKPLAAPVVGLASTPTGKGYWLLGRDGGVFSFGDAAFYGSTGAMVLNKPVVGMAAVPNGRGYWTVAEDGGIFAFGPDAKFHGSTGSLKLNSPIVAMSATPDGGGYWLAAADGGVFAFGNAKFYGSTGDIRLNSPIVAIASTPSGRGYRLLAKDGGIFSFGSASFQGSAIGLAVHSPAVGLTT